MVYKLESIESLDFLSVSVLSVYLSKYYSIIRIRIVIWGLN